MLFFLCGSTYDFAKISCLKTACSKHHKQTLSNHSVHLKCFSNYSFTDICWWTWAIWAFRLDTVDKVLLHKWQYVLPLCLLTWLKYDLLFLNTFSQYSHGNWPQPWFKSEKLTQWPNFQIYKKCIKNINQSYVLNHTTLFESYVL